MRWVVEMVRPPLKTLLASMMTCTLLAPRTQWPAVRTHSGWISVPVHNPPPRLRATTVGYCPVWVGVPPMIWAWAAPAVAPSRPRVSSAGRVVERAMAGTVAIGVADGRSPR